MGRIVVLDSGPTGDASKAPGNPSGIRCRVWIASLVAAGTEIIIPAMADYEVRRELIRAGMRDGVERLDDLRLSLNFLPLTDEALLTAAEFWAIVRNPGRPTAHHHALDGDAILAAQASL